MARRRQAPKSGFHPRQSPLKIEQLLRELKREARRIEAEQLRLVAEARAQGMSWVKIAAMTGMNSPQAARYRFYRPSTTEQ